MLIELGLLSFIGKCLFAGAVGAAIVAVVLSFTALVSWFRSKAALKNQSKTNVAVAVKDALANGQYSVVTGIYDTAKNEVLTAQQYTARTLDAETTRMFAAYPVVQVT